MLVIATVCGDPGGANALVPVLSLLESEPSVHLENYSYNEGEVILSRNGFDFTALSDRADENIAIDYLKKTEASILLTATSLNAVNWERSFFRAAKNLSVRSMAILDFWSGYRERFAESTEIELVIPDLLAVMDDRASTEAIRAGLPGSNIVITGQPAFDALSECRRLFDSVTELQLRDNIEAKADELIVLFVSQPLREMASSHGLSGQGFDEFLVVREVLTALERIAQDTGFKIALVLRLHPREAIDSYDWLESQHIRILISIDGNSRDLVMCADLVVGMNSVLLLEACHLGCVVVSVQPDMTGSDMLPTNRHGASHAVYKVDSIRQSLEEHLLNTSVRDSMLSRNKSLSADDGAAQRIAALILNNLNLAGITSQDC